MARDEQPDWWSDYAHDFGIRLHRFRVDAGLTQEQLAHAAGLTRSHYQQLEKGLSRPGVAANPSLMTVAGLAGVLGVTIAELVGEPVRTTPASRGVG